MQHEHLTRAEVLDPIGAYWQRVGLRARDNLERALRGKRHWQWATDQVLKRTDPVPKEPAVQLTTQGPTLIVWDLSAREIPSPSASARMGLSSTSSVNSAGNGFPSWSVTGDGERPPSP